MSSSVALTAKPTTSPGSEFSNTFRTTGSVPNEGRALSFLLVDPTPETDHGPLPALFVACTRTW